MKDKKYYDSLIDREFTALIDETVEFCGNIIPPILEWDDSKNLYVAKHTYEMDGEEYNMTMHLEDRKLDSGLAFTEATIMLGTFLDNGKFQAEDMFDRLILLDGKWIRPADNDEINEFYYNLPYNKKREILSKYRSFNVAGITE